MPLLRIPNGVAKHMNFFRLHVLAFTLVPLVTAAIFYGSNGSTNVTYIDALFLCTSAMTVTGLVTIAFSTITGWQQGILFILMFIGSTTFVSLITLLIRRNAFHDRFKDFTRTRAFFEGQENIHLRIRRVDTPALVNRLDPSGALSRRNEDLSTAPPETPSGTPETPGRREIPLGKRLPTIPRTTTLPRSATITFQHPELHHNGRSKENIDTRTRDLGGFPMPPLLLSRLFAKFTPRAHSRLSRTLSVPRTTTARSSSGSTYLNFDATVGRNSNFRGLTEDQCDELGGVEYRALRLLVWIVLAYYIGLILIAFAVVAPYVDKVPHVRSTIDDQQGELNPSWFAIFQVVSAYTNTGMSLGDTSLTQFQTAYAMTFMLAFLILAGNTALPVLLRFIIWIATKTVPRHSHTSETLHFLLDHPRRVYLYLFPAKQTWFLLVVVTALTLIDFVCFLVLDIGNDPIEALPVGIRVVCAFVQSVAVRTAGFNIINVQDVAPGEQIVFLVMMFIAIYPIAMALRGSNVYEERSLGIFEAPPKPEKDGDPQAVTPLSDPAKDTGTRVWGAYLGLHVKKQLAFDIWFITFALWIICIIERHNLKDDSKPYFTIFSILFELVSAYGTVGLSFGVATATYSLSGEFSTLSKLVVVVVMIRGRHRGLPEAIDRAVMLPSELQKQDLQDAQEDLERISLRRSASVRSRHSGIDRASSPPVDCKPSEKDS